MVKDKYILLIEDNDDDIELTKLAFNENKFANKIKVIKDGEAALNFLLRKDEDDEMKSLGKPIFILLDLNLPKVNGLDILSEIRKDAYIKHVPVIILTTSKQEDDVVKSYDLGANSYVRKPVKFQEFIGVISKLGVYWLAVNEPPSDD